MISPRSSRVGGRIAHPAPTLPATRFRILLFQLPVAFMPTVRRRTGVPGRPAHPL